jgi:hypothetical protein
MGLNKEQLCRKEAYAEMVPLIKSGSLSSAQALTNSPEQNATKGGLLSPGEKNCRRIILSADPTMTETWQIPATLLHPMKGDMDGSPGFFLKFGTAKVLAILIFDNPWLAS